LKLETRCTKKGYKAKLKCNKGGIRKERERRGRIEGREIGGEGGKCREWG